MDPEFEGLDENALKKMLEGAEDYEHRSKIRAAIRQINKASGKSGRRMTGTAGYVRPGFQAPRSITIPNSVTGNVMPSTVKDGVPVKPPDKSTPTIGYLNATTVVKSPRRTGNKKSSLSSYDGSGKMVKEEENWWRKSQSSSRSETPSDTLESRILEDKRESEPVFVETSEPPKQPSPSPELPKEKTPSPEPLKEPTPSPEPLKEPTPSPEPLKEPTPSPEPIREPTPSPEPIREPTPSPEPIREPTPSPEPVREPTPSPEPIREPTPSPEQERTPSPVIHQRHSPSPELAEDRGSEQEYEEEEEEGEFSDGEEEELKALEEREHGKLTSSIKSVDPLDVLQKVEPGLEENKDFRQKLRKSEQTKINTKAAFPDQRKGPEQVDFRNLLRKSTGPEKKEFKSGSKVQVDFRTSLKPKEKETTEDSISDVKIEKEVPQKQDSYSESPEQKEVLEEKKPVVDEDSYEARREARRLEKEDREKQLTEVQNRSEETNAKLMENGVVEESYEARREARRKAREARTKELDNENPEPRMSYKEKQQLEQAKRMEENKKKWANMDQTENVQKPPVTRQKSTGAQRGAQQLLAWCQHKTRYYENVEVKDFSSSFADGLALCAILHSFLPDEVPYDDLSPGNRRENFTVAMQVADDVGIGSFFDVEDMIIVKSPDPKSMMTFLATIYQHFK